MEFNQSFTSPSIPKLSKRTIASPFGKKSAIQKLSLKKTSFSFIKRSSVAETIEKTKDLLKPLETIKSDALITDALIETNQSLSEIKNQLEKFFALSIAEEKETLKKFKTDKARKRFTLKENVVESAKKIGSGLFKQVDQVLAPTKSIFQKLIDFFGIILTGIIVNSAFKWLENPENQKKVSQIFEFLAKNWKWILGLVGGAYLLRLLYKIYKVGKLIFGIIRLIRAGLKSFAPKLNQLPSSKPTQPPKITKSPLTRGQGQAPTARPAPPKPLLGGTGSPLARSPLSGYKGAGSAPARAPGIPGKGQGVKPSTKPSTGKSPKGIPFPGWLGKTLRVVGLGFLIAELMADWEKGDYKAIGVKLTAYGLGWAATALIGATGVAFGIGTAPTGAGAVAGLALAGSSMYAGSKVDEGVRAAFGYNDGGTVKGKDKRDQDSVLTFLTVGEKVVRKTSSMLFGPLIDDLNDNAGRLWDQFRQAVIQLTATNKLQKKISDVFGKVIDDFNKFLEDQIREAKLKKLSNTGGGTGGGSMSMKLPARSTSQPTKKKKAQVSKLNIGGAGMVEKTPPMPQISVYSPQQTIKPVVKTSTANNISQPITRSKPSLVPFAFDLPAIKTPMPQVPSMPSELPEVPNFTSVNMADPWIASNGPAKAYGIHVI